MIKAGESTQFNNHKQEKDMFVEVLVQFGIDKYGFILAFVFFYMKLSGFASTIC